MRSKVSSRVASGYKSSGWMPSLVRHEPHFYLSARAAVEASKHNVNVNLPEPAVGRGAPTRVAQPCCMHESREWSNSLV